MKIEPTVFHIWNDYTSSLFDQTHAYFLKKNNIRSRLLVAKLLQNKAQIHPKTYAFSTRSVDDIISPSFLSRVRNRISYILFWKQFQKFCRLRMQKERSPHSASPCLVHAHFGTTGAMITDLVEMEKLPAVVSFYGVDVSTVLRDPKWLKRYSKMFRTYTRFIVLCEAAKARLISHGCDGKKIHIWNLPAGIEAYPYQARKVKREFGTPIRFVTAARFVEKKGLDILLQAFAQVVQSGRSVTLSIIGYGPLKEKLELMARTLKVDTYVKFVDTHLSSDFKELYLSALQIHDIFVLPSTVGKDGDDEGGPALTLVCAQAAGLPVICTPFVGAEISVTDFKTGRICETDNSDSLAKIMIDLADHPEEWNKLGLAAAEKVAQEFGLDTQMEKLSKIYQEALTAPKS